MTDTIIETRNLGHRYAKDWAVQELNLQVPRGSVFGLLGENGAGKSTTLKMLMGLIPPSAGSATVLGFDPTKDDVAIKSRVGFVGEQDGFYEYMRIKDIVAFVAAYHRDWNSDLQHELLREFELEENSKISALSKGMRAKLTLLLALSFEPEVLLLDEPASGLDPAARRYFIETILSRYQQTGKTILLSSHLLNEFSGLIDHVAFIRDGRADLVDSVERLQEKMKRVRLVFGESAPADLQVNGSTQVIISGREALITFGQFEQERSMQELQALNATRITVEDMSLEDMFVARVANS